MFKCRNCGEEFSYENQTVMVAPMGGFYATKGLGGKKEDLLKAKHTIQQQLRDHEKLREESKLGI